MKCPTRPADQVPSIMRVGAGLLATGPDSSHNSMQCRPDASHDDSVSWSCARMFALRA